VDQDAIDAAAAELDESLIALRRDLNANPELAGQEVRTAAAVAARLAAAGLTVTTGIGGHGVMGVLEGDLPGRTVAYRADMDAVPVHEQIDGGTGPAHLCGHDVHTTVGVGIAEVLAQLRHRLCGTIVFVFQPAEETGTGAQAMLDEGVLESAAPEEIHALHCAPFPVGMFATTPGTGMPGRDYGVITVSGPDARDRAERLAADLGALATVERPQGSEDLERLLEDLMRPNSSLARFVALWVWLSEPAIGDQVKVEVVYRCWPEERFTEVRDAIGRVVDACGGAQVRFPEDPFPAMVCPEKDARELHEHLHRVLGPDSLMMAHTAFPFNGEDFGFFLQRIPGTYTFLGVRSPGSDIMASCPHFGTFDPDERAIGIGVRAMAGWLAQRADPVR
jgi:metal-dependent amidase/aminoacylase/carboxypeptidase family protein